MSPAAPTTQTAAERRAAEAELNALLETIAPEYRGLVGTLRRSLKKRLPTAHEVVYEYADSVVISFSPSGHGHEGVLSIRACDRGVDLYLSIAKKLPDPEKLLKGSAKLVRFITVESAATLRRKAVGDLIDAAIKLNGGSFARSGGGTIVVRPTTAQKRRGK
jgi:hypothetical protein